MGRDFTKNGFVRGKQRYKCKICASAFIEGDKREKYGIEKKLKALKMYVDGIGLRSIERAEGVPSSLLARWVRQAGKMIKQELASTQIPDDVKKIEILEMDELFTFYKKKSRKPMCGLLWTETGTKLLIL